MMHARTRHRKGSALASCMTTATTFSFALCDQFSIPKE